MDPTPGSITSTLSVESLNQIVQLAAPLMMNELLTNKTYEIGYKNRGWLGIYDFKINDVHCNTVSQPKINQLAFKQDTNELVYSLSGVDFDFNFNASSKVMLVPWTLKSVAVQNFTMHFGVETSTSDQVHWAIKVNPYFHVDSLAITLGETLWNKLHALLHTPFMWIADYVFSHWVPDQINSKVRAFNEQVDSEGPMTFISKILGVRMPINMTMTKWPQLRSSD
jgi:hypothetical protein